MFKRFKNKYEADFKNPVIIEVYGYVIRLFNRCSIVNDMRNCKIMLLVTVLTGRNSLYKFCLLDYKIPYSEGFEFFRVVDNVNQAIEDTYKPGGHMYNKSEQIVEELTNIS